MTLWKVLRAGSGIMVLALLAACVSTPPQSAGASPGAVNAASSQKNDRAQRHAALRQHQLEVREERKWSKAEETLQKILAAEPGVVANDPAAQYEMYLAQTSPTCRAWRKKKAEIVQALGAQGKWCSFSNNYDYIKDFQETGFLTASATAGYLPAQATLGFKLIKEPTAFGLPDEAFANFKKGMDILTKAALKGSTKAMVDLALLYNEGTAGAAASPVAWVVPQDGHRAAEWAQKALAAADLDAVETNDAFHPQVRAQMEAIVNADAERMQQAKNIALENEKSAAAWRADAPRREAAARQAEKEHQAQLAAWQSKPRAQRASECEAECQNSKTVCDFGNTTPSIGEMSSLMNGNYGEATFHHLMKKDCDTNAHQCQETCIENGY